ncbi:hypothetical protein BpHYR1_001208 [Brachionus plicatilis]|uniref:Uncharacterized protein n=1 Tax=Brachionus plicatilis TaxID=10195 RepID=A0A3M7PAJ1_BRAPC|nr:hypothetical protein BpHYR1_001208 [Brachionus plicatilis]
MIYKVLRSLVYMSLFIGEHLAFKIESILTVCINCKTNILGHLKKEHVLELGYQHKISVVKLFNLNLSPSNNLKL